MLIVLKEGGRDKSQKNCNVDGILVEEEAAICYIIGRYLGQARLPTNQLGSACRREQVFLVCGQNIVISLICFEGGLLCVGN